MTVKEHRQTATIMGPDGRESRGGIVSEDLLAADEIQDLLTQATTAPGAQAEPIHVARAPASEIAERLGLLEKCQAITQDGHALQFMGIGNPQVHRFMVVSAPSIREMGILIGEVIARISCDCQEEDVDTFLESVNDGSRWYTARYRDEDH